MLSFVRDDKTGAVSHTKLWANVGYAAMTAVFLRLGWTGHVDAWFLFAYGSVVSGSHIAANLVNRRYGATS